MDHTISRNLALSTDEREPLTMALDLKGHTVPQGLWGPGGDGEALFRGKKGSLQIRLRVKHDESCDSRTQTPSVGAFRVQAQLVSWATPKDKQPRLSKH